MAVDACLAGLLAGLLPGLEPRYGVVLLSRCLPLSLAVAAALVEALALAAALAWLAEWGLRVLLPRLPAGLRGWIEARLGRAQARLQGRLERLGAAALALFVAAPLPLTGLYTGAAVAALLGVPRRDALLALAAGGAASVLIVAAGLQGFTAAWSARG